MAIFSKSGQIRLWPKFWQVWPDLSTGAVGLHAGPALGMFEMFGRTGPLTIGGPPFWTLKILLQSNQLKYNSNFML